jgi:hypothetical protein
MLPVKLRCDALPLLRTNADVPPHRRQFQRKRLDGIGKLVKRRIPISGQGRRQRFKGIALMVVQRSNCRLFNRRKPFHQQLHAVLAESMESNSTRGLLGARPISSMRSFEYARANAQMNSSFQTNTPAGSSGYRLASPGWIRLESQRPRWPSMCPRAPVTQPQHRPTPWATLAQVHHCPPSDRRRFP